MFHAEGRTISKALRLCLADPGHSKEDGGAGMTWKTGIAVGKSERYGGQDWRESYISK